MFQSIWELFVYSLVEIIDIAACCNLSRADLGTFCTVIVVVELNPNNLIRHRHDGLRRDVVVTVFYCRFSYPLDSTFHYYTV